MNNEKIFRYSDIDYLLENVPFDPFKENDSESPKYIKKILGEYDFYEYGKNSLLEKLGHLSRNLDLQKEIQYLYGCVDFYIDAFDYFCDKKGNKILNDFVNVTIRKIGENLMQKVDAFCYLFIAGDYSDAISISRSIYELVLSSHLIYEYPQLAEPYRDKEIFLRYKFAKDFNNDFYSYLDKKVFYSFISKYGKTLNENFGWTAKVFPNKEERFHRNLASKLKLHNVFDSFYQKSCAYVHSAPYSLIHQELHECIPFCGWVLALLDKYCNDFFSLSFMSKKEKVIMTTISSNIILNYIKELTKQIDSLKA